VPTRAALAAVLALALPAAAVAGCGGSDSSPPAAGAARLVPSDALVYVSVSTDAKRDVNKRAGKVAAKFPSYRSLRDQIVGRLATTGGRVDFERDVQPWLGKEAALALLNAGGDTAGSLVLLDVGDEKGAHEFADRSTRGQATANYHGVELHRGSSATSAFIDHYLAIGQDATVKAAIDVRDGRHKALPDDATYKRAVKGMPEGRVADGYASSAGVTRLLAPQSGVLGFIGTLLLNPALDGAALAVTPDAPGARIWEHSVLDAEKAKNSDSPFEPFEPSLTGDVPKNAIAYLGITRLDRAIGPLLTLAGGAGGSLGALLDAARQGIAKDTGVDVQRDVVSLFKGEVALVITPGEGAPILTVIAHAKDEAKTRSVLAKLQDPLSKLLAPAGAGPGAIPQFESRDAGGGVKAFGIRLSSTLELDYAVFDGKLVISTGLDGIRAVREGGGLDETDDYRDVLGEHPKKVTSLIFLDFNQLLDLAEQSGLNQSPSYARIRNDLRRVRTVGASTAVGEAESTAELRFKIP
jgi:hypothetical protein